MAVRTPFHTIHIETADGAIEARPIILTTPSEARPCDWVLVATKTYDLAPTKAWLAALVGPVTRVAVLQNGVEHVARFSDVVPVERLVPAVVDITAERIAAGVVRQRRAGTMVVPSGRDGEAYVALFKGCPIRAGTTDDFATAAWTKLASNCTGAVNALVRRPAGIVARDDIADVNRALVRECVAVGRAEGAALPDTLPDRVVEAYRAGPADAVNSLMAEVIGGRPTELDARNGVIVRLGARHGIATPMNALMVALLDAASTGTFSANQRNAALA